jgi:hypothetical protein
MAKYWWHLMVYSAAQETGEIDRERSPTFSTTPEANFTAFTDANIEISRDGGR